MLSEFKRQLGGVLLYAFRKFGGGLDRDYLIGMHLVMLMSEFLSLQTLPSIPLILRRDLIQELSEHKSR